MSVTSILGDVGGLLGNLSGFAGGVLGGADTANSNNAIQGYASRTPLQPWQISNNGVTAGYAGNSIFSNLGPSLTGAGTGLQGLALAGTNAANGFMSGGLPSNIASGIGTYNGNFGAINPGLLALFGGNVSGNAAAGSLINSGFTQLNNPLISQATGAAGNQIATAGADFNSVYQQQLANLQKQLQLPQQLQMNANQSGQFARGQLGTTGGALQTQAMATGFGQADLAAAQQAYQQALAAQNSATQNAGILGTLASNQQLTGTSLLNSGFNALTGTGYAGNYLGSNINNIGTGNINTQSQISTLPTSLAGASLTNLTGPALGYNNLLDSLGLNNINAAMTGGNLLSLSNARAADVLNTNRFAGQTGASNALGAAGNLLGGGNSSGLINDVSKLFGGNGGDGGFLSSIFGGGSGAAALGAGLTSADAIGLPTVGGLESTLPDLSSILGFSSAGGAAAGGAAALGAGLTGADAIGLPSAAGLAATMPGLGAAGGGAGALGGGALAALGTIALPAAILGGIGYGIVSSLDPSQRDHIAAVSPGQTVGRTAGGNAELQQGSLGYGVGGDTSKGSGIYYQLNPQTGGQTALSPQQSLAMNGVGKALNATGSAPMEAASWNQIYQYAQSHNIPASAYGNTGIGQAMQLYQQYGGEAGWGTDFPTWLQTAASITGNTNGNLNTTQLDF